MDVTIRKQIKQLRDEHGACGLKLGTEAEACTFEDIRFVMGEAAGILPVIVKIGGPEARNDIRTLNGLGIQGLIAPMIESRYAMELFVKTLTEMAPHRLNQMLKAINIESISAVERLDEIFDSPLISQLDQITIGRTDLSSSMSLPVDHPDVTAAVKKVRTAAGHRGLEVSIGGAITPGSAELIAREISPEKINIRTVVIDIARCPSPAEAITKSLEFEISLLRLKAQESEDIAAEARKRITVIEGRLRK